MLAQLERGEAAQTALANDPADLEALYRVARARLLTSEREDHASRLEAHALGRALLVHCAEHAPALDGGGPSRWLGQLDARPALAALRDLQTASARFEQAIASAPRDPRNHLAYATHYAVTAQDREAFERAIASARGSKDSSPAAVRARADAERLSEQAGELFE
jgi:hypothetical protein